MAGDSLDPIRRKLEEARRRLLDLTLANRLINFRHTSKSTLRVIDEVPDQLFGRLISEKEMVFRPVPTPAGGEPEEDDVEPTSKQKGKEQRARAEAKRHHLNPDYDLPVSGKEGSAPSKHSDNAIQTLLFPADLESSLRTLARTARTAIEETGSNMLYLVFGFLEWYEREDAETPHLAPLFLVPVSLTRGDPDPKTRTYRYELRYSGEEIAPNYSLQEKLKRDFARDLPEPIADETPESYLDRLDGFVAEMPRWRVRRMVTLSILQFGKILLFRDLDPRRWPAGRGPDKHDVVRALIDGVDRGAEVQTASEHPIDQLDDRGALPAVVLDADSSQHSAIVDAMQGRNLVIEGPPGTGKSQTIANLIAAAMVEGKSVLFVAEKLAALSVVRDRLANAGLAAFSIELHSSKGSATAVHEDLRARLGCRGTFREPRELDEKLRVLRSTRADLTTHVTEMNAPFGKRGLTAFEIFWRYDALRSTVAHHREWLDEIDLAGSYVQSLTVEHHEWIRQAATAFAANLALCARGGALTAHPWSGVSAERDGVHDSDLLKPLQLLTEGAKSLHTTIDGFSTATGVRIDTTLSAGAVWAQGLTALRGISLGAAASRWLPAISSDNVGAFEELCSLHALQVERESSFARRRIDHRAIHQRLDLFNSLYAELAREVVPRATLGICDGVAAKCRSLAVLLQSLLASRERLRFALGLDPCEQAHELAFVPVIVDLVRTAPFEALATPIRLPEDDSTDVMLHAAAAETRRLQDVRERLGRDYAVDRLADSESLRRAASTCRTAGFFRFLSSSWRSAKRLFGELRTAGELPKEEMAAAFDSLADFAEQRAAFEGRSDLSAGLGARFRGIDTDFAPLIAARDWQSAARRRLKPLGARGVADVRALLAGSGAELHQAAAQIGEPPRGDIRAELEALRGALPRMVAAIDREAVTSVLPRLEAAAEVLERASRAFGEVMPATYTVEDVESVLAEVRVVASEEAALLAHPALGWIGGAALAEVAPLLREATAVARRLDAASMPPALRTWLTADYAPRLDWLLGWSDHVAAAVAKIESAHTDFVRAGQVDLATWYGGADWRELALQRLAARGEAALRDRDSLAAWLGLLRARGGLNRSGLQAVVGRIASGTLGHELAWPACEYVLFRLLVRELLSAKPSFGAFSGTTHETLRDAFKRIDQECLMLSRQRAGARIDAREAPAGNTKGAVGTFTELGLLQHEATKQRRHIAVRQLVKRAAAALVAIKPCFMMSPQSVAQFLEPGAVTFDLVVMDEASQLRPEDALGAVARGRQLVVVGDTKQLPPTSFFARRVEEDEDDEGKRAIDDAESILEVASSIFQPARQLRWHYRSRHESLIAFSNRHFYDENLFVFPAPAPASRALGVSFERVEGGTWDGHKNVVEGRAVIDRVLEHLRTSPSRKLGVVAMNVAQQQFLQDEAEQRLQQEPELLALFDTHVFIKNLENVQGDEADIIFLSMTYAPDEGRSEMHQRFGPIVGASGPRRLNVLFTRARYQVVVFASFDPSMMKAEATTNRAVLLLKEYLEFAKTGSLGKVKLSAEHEPQSDFERSVASALQRRGLDAVPQIGVARYYIDLGIRHPKRPGDFILGVECDGAMYHSSYSARDRDRLRQGVLEGLGWELHRIWSTDWFRQPERQIDRIVERVEKLIAREANPG